VRKNKAMTTSDDHRIALCSQSRRSRTTFILCCALLFLGLSIPLTVFAVSYVPAHLYHQHDGLETTMGIGDTVYLFHSGTDDAKKTIHVSDILTVHRTNPSCQITTVRRIKVISYIGETYLKGVVIEGETKPNDIAKKGDVSCLIILVGECPP
jgi:hypothetical protein